MAFESTELEQLLLDWEDGTLSEAGIERIRQLLRTDEAARKQFVELQMLNAALSLGDIPSVLQVPHTSAAAKDSIRTTTAADPRSVGGPVRRHRWVLMAATLLVGLLAGRWLYLESGSRRTIPPTISDRVEATSQGIALVTRLVDVVWPDDQSSAEVGDALSPGLIAIDSGYVQIEFFCGATVVLEGPAQLELESSTLARLRSGRLRAQVPPAARGFSINVDDMQVVDLGTEFGLDVSTDGADVQVFDGEVELHQADQQPALLSSGNAIRRTDGKVVAATTTPDRFLGIADLESRAKNQTDDRYQKWRAYSEKLKSDPRLITYYLFDEQQSWRRKLESSLEPPNGELDGAIVGAHRTTGRWPDKGALEFKRPADRVRVQIPGEFGALTLACWVRIDSLDRWYNSLFLTDGYEQGEPHWQILDSGQLFFSVRARADWEPGPHHQKVLSPPFWNPSMSGKWLHLATVFDPDEKRVTHYLDGKVLSQELIPDRQLMTTTRIGTASIGNWAAPTKPDEHFAIRNLNGRIDEFALFKAALGDTEIREMYEHGRP